MELSETGGFYIIRSRRDMTDLMQARRLHSKGERGRVVYSEKLA